MPSTSSRQEAYMRAAAHNSKFAKKVGISQSVAKEFETTDKNKKSQPSHTYKENN